jgi:hypothetical protein
LYLRIPAVSERGGEALRNEEGNDITEVGLGKKIGFTINRYGFVIKKEDKQMKETKTKVNKEEQKAWEQSHALNNAGLLLQCVEAGILDPAKAGEYMVPIFETLGIIKKEK